MSERLRNRLIVCQRASVAIVVTASLCTIAAFASTARGGPASAPVDRGTQDALSDIDSVSPAQPATQRVNADPDGDGRMHPGHHASESEWAHWSGLVWFFAPGLITAAAIGISGSVVGTFVLLRREALLALALPQVVATGAALGMRLGWPTIPPAMIVAGAALVYLSLARRRETRHGRPASGLTVPVLYVAGLSLSFLIIAGGGAHVAELQNLFTGIDVAVTPLEATIAAPILIAIALLCGLLWRRWLCFAQAPAAAELAGLGPTRWNLLFLALLTIVVLIGTDAQGVVLVLAMLFLPAAIVLPWARRIPVALAAGAVVAGLCVIAAFVVSNEMSWPFSQCAGGVGFSLFLLSRAASIARLGARP